MHWKPYVPVARRRARAHREIEKRRRQGKAVEPVEIEGRQIARSFWGKGWCDHLESFADFESRLPRGRAYVRNGSVCHLAIAPGAIEALVSGSALYRVEIRIDRLSPARWRALRKRCAGRIGSLLELLQGRLSDQVMSAVSDRRDGLFPQPGEMHFRCSCPDWAAMCKHVAAVLYGVGHRLDEQPELLFVLRAVEVEALIADGADTALPAALGASAADDALADDRLGEIFGIELADTGGAEPARAASGGGSAAAAAVTADRDGDAETLSDEALAEILAALPRRAFTGRDVAELRRQCGLSVAALADLLAVSPASVYRWEATPGVLRLRERPLLALCLLHRRFHDLR